MVRQSLCLILSLLMWSSPLIGEETTNFKSRYCQDLLEEFGHDLEGDLNGIIAKVKDQSPWTSGRISRALLYTLHTRGNGVEWPSKFVNDETTSRAEVYANPDLGPQIQEATKEFRRELENEAENQAEINEYEALVSSEIKKDLMRYKNIDRRIESLRDKAISYALEYLVLDEFYKEIRAKRLGLNFEEHIVNIPEYKNGKIRFVQRSYRRRASVLLRRNEVADKSMGIVAGTRRRVKPSALRKEVKKLLSEQSGLLEKLRIYEWRLNIYDLARKLGPRQKQFLEEVRVVLADTSLEPPEKFALAYTRSMLWYELREWSTFLRSSERFKAGVFEKYIENNPQVTNAFTSSLRKELGVAKNIRGIWATVYEQLQKGFTKNAWLPIVGMGSGLALGAWNYLSDTTDAVIDATVGPDRAIQQIVVMPEAEEKDAWLAYVVEHFPAIFDNTATEQEKLRYEEVWAKYLEATKVQDDREAAESARERAALEDITRRLLQNSEGD